MSKQKPNEAYLHWCRLEDVGAIVGGGGVSIDGKTVQQDKHVQMFAERASASYGPPKKFTIRLEAFFLKKLARKVGAKWHPINPFRAVQPPGSDLFFAERAWDTGTSDVLRQARYFFKDDLGNKSGTLTVSQAEHSTTHAGIGVEGHVTLKVPGGSAGLGLKASRSTIIERIGASQDPDVRVSILVPGGSGETDLLPYIRAVLLEIDPDLNPSRLSDSALVEASGGYLEPARWQPRFDRDGEEALETVVSVGPERDVELSIPLDSGFGSPEPFRTVYALRVADVENDSNYVIGDIVEVEQTANFVRVRF